MNIVLVCPTAFEMELLRAIARETGMDLLVCGVGPVQAAYATTRYLEKNPLDLVILAGIGGAYREPLLDSGKAFVAKSEVFADLGRCSGDGFEPIEMGEISLEISYNLVKEGDGLFEMVKKSSRLGLASMATVSCASGSRERGAMISSFFGVDIENMEGAAVSLVCKNYRVRFIELRSISNLAGDTNKANWDIKGALEILCEGFKELVDLLELPGKKQ